MSLLPQDPQDMQPQHAGPSASEEFSSRLVQILNDGCLALLMSIGAQTDLFEVLATLPPASSEEIARAAKLEERYVREWLGGMVVGGIVRYDAAACTYFLPPEHAALLTRAAGPDNFSSFMTYIPMMGEVDQAVVQAFRNGGGVPYSAFPRFQQLQQQESRQLYGAHLVQTVIPMDRELEQRLGNGIDVLDIGTGSGHATNLLARAFPSSRFTGIDFSQQGIESARAEARAWNLTNVSFEVHDVAGMGFHDAFGLVTAFDVIHDLAAPRKVLRAVRAALKRSGVFLMVDIAASSRLEDNFDHPLAPALFTFSSMHCMAVSLEQGGEGLGTMWGEQKAAELLNEAGFSQVEIRKIDGDILHAFYFARP